MSDKQTVDCGCRASIRYEADGGDTLKAILSKIDYCPRHSDNSEAMAALEKIARDIILDRQDIEYYKRLLLIHKDWVRATLAKVKGGLQ